MEDFAVVKTIVEVFYGIPFKDAEEMALNPSIPKCLLTEDFSDKAKFLLFVKAQIVAHRWSKFFDTCYKKMFSSHEKYLTFVIFVCVRENACNRNAFESFVSVCVLLNFLCFETFQKTGLNFKYLNLLTMMALYANVLSHAISRSGGCQRLIEFIRDHRYHKYKPKESPIASTSLSAPEADLKKEIEKELLRDCVTVEEIDVDEAENDELSIKMAKDVLKGCNGIYKHPSLPSLEDVAKSMDEYKKKEKAEIKLLEAAEESAATNVNSDKCSNSITESKTNGATNYQDSTEQYESIIQAVIRHNRSKNSGLQSANNKIQEAANGVLQHLKQTIEKLTKVLNQFDKD